MCEDYRAGAYVDYELDKADLDAGKKITIPMLALWGDAGIARPPRQRRSTPGSNGRPTSTGTPVDCGHFLTEENPDVTESAAEFSRLN